MIINYRDGILDYAKKDVMWDVSKKVEEKFRKKIMKSVSIPQRVLGEFLSFEKSWEFYEWFDWKRNSVWFYQVIDSNDSQGKIFSYVSDMDKMETKKRLERFEYISKNMWKLDGYWVRKVTMDEMHEAFEEMLKIIKKYLND